MKLQRAAIAMFSICIFGLFLLVTLLLITSGAHSYREIAGNQADNNNSRMVLSTIATSVHADDAAGSIRIEEGPQSQALIIVDEADYATRFYLCDGYLVEDYLPYGSDYGSVEYLQIAELNEFQVEADGSMLTLSTDYGTLKIALRSEGGIVQ